MRSFIGMRPSADGGNDLQGVCIIQDMPRYFFHVYHGDEQYIDDVGEELPDRHAAWHEATVSAGQSIRDLDGKLQPGTDWRMDVVDERGRLIFALHVSAHSKV